MSEYKDFNWRDPQFTDAHSYIFPVIEKLLPSKDCVILDAGCGNGAIANCLINKGYNVYGIDASETGINIANKGNKGRFYLQDLSTKKLPEELNEYSFNSIISTEVIEHLYNPNEYITFCKNILQKSGGGELIISTPYHGYLKSLAISICGQWDTHFGPSFVGGHIKFWSKKTLSMLLEKEGFEVLDFKGCGRFPFLWKSMILKARI